MSAPLICRALERLRDGGPRRSRTVGTARRAVAGLTVASVAALGLGACGGPGQASAPSVAASLPPVAAAVDPLRATGFTVGIASYSVESPYQAALADALRTRAAELDVAVVSTDAGGDAAQLAADVTSLLEAGVDGIIVSAAELVNAPGVALAMRDSRVSLVFVDRAFDSGPYNAVIGPDYSNVGWDSCEYLGGLLGGRGKVALIEGGPVGHPVGTLLREGFEGCAEEAFGEMTVVTTDEPGDWTEEGGARAMSSLMAEHPDLAAVFCENDSMCLGAQRAAADAGRADQLVVVGVGGTAEALQAVEDGTGFIATSLIDAQAIGEHGVNVMVSIFKRQDFVRNSYVPSPLVRLENLSEYEDTTRTY